ncbi:MAG: hypothetical protein ACOZIN_09150 [Myxococcota bacterium]
METEALKPQDVVVALKLACVPQWNYQGLQAALRMSSSTIHEAVRRLSRARLFNPQRRRVVRADLIEFLEHGVRFAFPVVLGAPVLGVPTASSAEPLRHRLLSGDERTCVWPSKVGSVRGRSVVPLHPGVPEAVRDDPKLHRLLAIVDALRVGDARERELAAEELRKEL